MQTNNKLKITAIVRFDHSAVAVGREMGRHEFVSFEALQCFAECRGYEINVTHAHPAGLPSEALLKEGEHIKQEERERIIPVLRSVCVK